MALTSPPFHLPQQNRKANDQSLFRADIGDRFREAAALYSASRAGRHIVTKNDDYFQNGAAENRPSKRQKCRINYLIDRVIIVEQVSSTQP